MSEPEAGSQSGEPHAVQSNTATIPDSTPPQQANTTTTCDDKNTTAPQQDHTIAAKNPLKGGAVSAMSPAARHRATRQFSAFSGLRAAGKTSDQLSTGDQASAVDGAVLAGRAQLPYNYTLARVMGQRQDDEARGMAGRCSAHKHDFGAECKSASDALDDPVKHKRWRRDLRSHGDGVASKYQQKQQQARHAYMRQVQSRLEHLSAPADPNRTRRPGRSGSTQAREFPKEGTVGFADGKYSKPHLKSGSVTHARRKMLGLRATHERVVGEWDSRHGPTKQACQEFLKHRHFKPKLQQKKGSSVLRGPVVGVFTNGNELIDPVVREGCRFYRWSDNCFKQRAQ